METQEYRADLKTPPESGPDPLPAVSPGPGSVHLSAAISVQLCMAGNTPQGEASAPGNAGNEKWLHGVPGAAADPGDEETGGGERAGIRLCLEFVAPTARLERRGWAEIDWDRAKWTVPAKGRARALVAAVVACGWRCWIGPKEIEDGSGASFRASKYWSCAARR